MGLFGLSTGVTGGRTGAGRGPQQLPAHPQHRSALLRPGGPTSPWLQPIGSGKQPRAQRGGGGEPETTRNSQWGFSSVTNPASSVTKPACRGWETSDLAPKIAGGSEAAPGKLDFPRQLRRVCARPRGSGCQPQPRAWEQSPRHRFLTGVPLRERPEAPPAPCPGRPRGVQAARGEEEEEEHGEGGVFWSICLAFYFLLPLSGGDQPLSPAATSFLLRSQEAQEADGEVETGAVPPSVRPVPGGPGGEAPLTPPARDLRLRESVARTKQQDQS